MFAGYPVYADIPDPDLLIRTSGEQRISNFLLWQLAYAELIFVDTLWPDFSQSRIWSRQSESSIGANGATAPCLLEPGGIVAGGSHPNSLGAVLGLPVLIRRAGSDHPPFSS